MENMEMPGAAGGGSNARNQVSVPAILLMVLGGLTILSALWGLVQAVSGSNAAQMAQLSEALNNPDLPPQFRSAMGSYMNFAGRSGPFMSLFQLVLGGLTAFGGLKMKNLQSYPLAIAASIVAIIPCFNCCYCLGIPLGIWSLIVLNKAEVKAAFRP